MWKVLSFVFTILLVIALARSEQTVTAIIEPDGITTTTAPASTAPVETTSYSPQGPQHSSESLEYITSSTTSAPLLEESTHPQDTSTSRSRITYDQRQDGHYNIRADLDIIIVPSSPMAAANLLDMLSGLSLRRSNANKLYKKKHSMLPMLGVRQADDLRIGAYLQRNHERHSVNNPARRGEFIEGRTPYSVDISSSDGDFLEDSHVDVLPPIPFSMQDRHIPSDWHSSQLLRRFRGSSGDRHRFAKAIGNAPIDLKELLTNRVSSDGRSYTATQEFIDASKEPAHEKIGNAYIHFADISTLPLSYDLGPQYETRSSAAILSPLDKNWELKLIGASEQCGPGRKRDSYGICQFLPEYN